MKIEQLYTGCLAQGAYYIHDNGEGIVIDPLREVATYIKKAKEDNVKIKYIFETHFHADFVSGHLTLSKETKAPIVYGPLANPSFEAIIAKDKQEFSVGNCTIRVLHTPGHTMESTSYLLLDEHNKELAIFTGDTLFLGDVGRPDLAQKADELTMEDLAGFGYDSLRNKIMPLPDDILVYPAHGAGSACGKNMMKQTVDTLGNQKKMNYALRADMTKEEYIAEVTADLSMPPSYFPSNVKLNKEGYRHFDEILKDGLRALSPFQFSSMQEQEDIIVLDVRKPQEFVKGHIPNSIFIGLDGSFAPWVGELLVDISQKLLIVAPIGRAQETITRLARVGFDHVVGYLEGGMEQWNNTNLPVATIKSIEANEFAELYDSIKDQIFDVRRSGEFGALHVQNANLTPLSELNIHMNLFPKDQNIYIHCAGGYRSVIAASILKSRGYHSLVDIKGGFGAIRKSSIPLTSEKITCS